MIVLSGAGLVLEIDGRGPAPAGNVAHAINHGAQAISIVAPDHQLTACDEIEAHDNDVALWT